MTTTTYYIAYDGKIFNDEKECLEYEFHLESEKYKDVALLFDDEGNKLPLDATSINKCYWIVALSNGAANFINDLFKEEYLPWEDHRPKAGAWTFFEGEWNTFEEFSKLVKIYKKLQELLDK